MYHLRLKKALSYMGEVTATKGKPDVFTEDRAIADKAIASGYFDLISEDAEPEKTFTGHLDPAQLEEMKLDDLKRLAADMGVDTSTMKKKSDFINAITAVEVEAGGIHEPDAETEV